VIVRILGEGQLRVDEAAAGELSQLDAKLEAAVQGNDEPGFKAALGELLTRVRAIGRPVEPGDLEPSELILPGPDASMEDVRKLLAGDGLIPG